MTDPNNVLRLADFAEPAAAPVAALAIPLPGALSADSKATQRLKARLPKGVTIGFRTDGRGKPHYVRFGKGASRTVETFATEKERNIQAEKLAAGVFRVGTGTFDFDPAKWAAFVAFERRIGITLEEAERIIAKARGNLVLNLTVTEACDRYLAQRKQGVFSADNRSHSETHLKRFKAAYGHLPLFCVTTDNVRDWLHGAADTKGKRHGATFEVRQRQGSSKTSSPCTLKHHLATVTTFFERAVLDKWCPENPCAAVEEIRIPVKPVNILRAREVFDLLKANRDLGIGGRMALELFGGMRCASVEQVNAAEVKDTAQALDMPADKHKSGRRHYRQGHLPILWAWVEHAAPTMFADVTVKNYDYQKRLAFVRAGVKATHNVLRHSFASYMLAHTKDASRVSYLMQHTSLAMTKRYEGVADDRDAALVLAMTPAAVAGTWEEFLAAEGKSQIVNKKNLPAVPTGSSSSPVHEENRE